MRIAIIGAGNVGKTLGGSLRAKGHAIVYGVRDPTKKPEERSAKLAEINQAVATVRAGQACGRCVIEMESQP